MTAHMLIVCRICAWRLGTLSAASEVRVAACATCIVHCQRSHPSISAVSAVSCPVCVCVCACVRACVCACVRVPISIFAQAFWLNHLLSSYVIQVCVGTSLIVCAMHVFVIPISEEHIAISYVLCHCGRGRFLRSGCIRRQICEFLAWGTSKFAHAVTKAVLPGGSCLVLVRRNCTIGLAAFPTQEALTIVPNDKIPTIRSQGCLCIFRVRFHVSGSDCHRRDALLRSTGNARATLANLELELIYESRRHPMSGVVLGLQDSDGNIEHEQHGIRLRAVFVSSQHNVLAQHTSPSRLCQSLGQRESQVACLPCWLCSRRVGKSWYVFDPDRPNQVQHALCSSMHGVHQASSASWHQLPECLIPRQECLRCSSIRQHIGMEGGAFPA